MDFNSKSFQVVTKKDTSYVDLFRYATDKTLQKVWNERMKDEYDNYPTVNHLRNIYILYLYHELKPPCAKLGNCILNM